MPKMARGDRFDTRISLVPGIPALRMTDTIHRVLETDYSMVPADGDLKTDGPPHLLFPGS